jgi:hypothetical protein
MREHELLPQRVRPPASLELIVQAPLRHELLDDAEVRRRGVAQEGNEPRVFEPAADVDLTFEVLHKPALLLGPHILRQQQLLHRDVLVAPRRGVHHTVVALPKRRTERQLMAVLVRNVSRTLLARFRGIQRRLPAVCETK